MPVFSDTMGPAKVSEISVPIDLDYGDLMVRDRKMYVAPTPFALLEGVTSLPTLIVPADYAPDGRFQQVGRATFSRVSGKHTAHAK